MERLKKDRASARRTLTKLTNDISDLLAAENPNQITIQVKLALLDNCHDKLIDLNGQVRELLLDEDATDEVLDAEDTAVMEYDSKFEEINLRAKPVTQSRRASPTPSEAASSVSAGDEDGKKRNYKLPKIQLKKFTGELKEWLGWWSQFQKIDEDESLHESDKFQYLVQCMVPGSRARKVIEKFPQTAENYPKAVTALKERFGKPDLLIEVYARELNRLCISNATNKESTSIMQMFDELEIQLKALASLGVTTGQCALFVYPFVESSLPPDVLRTWQRCDLSKRDGSQEEPPKTKLDFLMEFLKQEAENEIRFDLAKQESFDKGEKAKAPPEKKQVKGKPAAKENNISDSIATASELHVGTASGCVFCDKSHPSQDCIKAQGMNLYEKTKKVKEKGCCYICLRPGHNANSCRCPVKCIVCSKKHQTVMCPELPANKKRPEPSKPAEDVPSQLAMLNQVGQVLLGTLLLRLEGKRNSIIVRAVLDCGAMHSTITSNTAKLLELPQVGEYLRKTELYGGVVTKEKKHTLYQVSIQGLNGCKRKLVMSDEPRICGPLSRIPHGPWLEYLKKRNIRLTDFHSESEEIEILIGNDYLQEIYTGKRVPIDGGPVAVETIFGWTLNGRLPNSQVAPSMLSTDLMSSASVALQMFLSDASVSDLWNLEIIGIQDSAEIKTKQEKDADTKRNFMDTVSRNEDGRYSVRLPWIDGVQQIPDNRAVAHRRLLSSTTKLLKCGKMDDYDKMFRSWEDEGIIEVVHQTNTEENCLAHYLPHRAVFKLESKTTPIRPVFDASCKVGRNPSLNECLEKGPNLLELIPDILHRFREKQVGVLSDIRKAFQMIDVKEEDRDFQRFLWWEDYEKNKVKIYRHRRVVFGINCSPFLLAAVIEYHMKNVDVSLKPIAEKFLRSLYVDNCVTSVDTLEEYEEFKQITTKLLAEAKMELRQWECNAEELSGVGPLSSSGCGLDDGSILSPSVFGVSSVLGLKWDKKTDTLSCQAPVVDSGLEVTKRLVLSQLQKVYDPLGFLCPVLLYPKLLVQETWESKITWDEELPIEMKNRFQDWLQQVPILENIHIPRRLSMLQKDDNWKEKVEIHTFCDASQYAYAVVIFLRTVAEGEVTVRFVQAKARIAPKKKISIPRLELLACTVGARLTSSVKNALQLDVPTFLWSDSTTALAWIKRNDLWGTFVGNRVKEICLLTNPVDWRHAPGVHNPADLPSRGCSSSQLLDSRWWEGPKWLAKDSVDWPTEDIIVDEEVILSERRKKIPIQLFKADSKVKNPWYINKYSNYSSNIRVIAWMWRGVEVLTKRPAQRGWMLSAKEMERAERKLIQLIQKEFVVTSDDVIEGIQVTRDGDGLLCVSSKLLHRQDAERFRLPYLLPGNHPIVDKLIFEVHLNNRHAGVQFLMSTLREKYWILQGRKNIKRILSSCVICKRFNVRAVTVPCAPLPEDRVKDAKAFQVTGIDLAGPLYLKDKSKVWLVLFTCAVYRGIHLELVDSLSTDSFLLALLRFISRRGRPSTVYTDNGTNFVGAVNLFKELNWNRIQRETRHHRIEWKFIAPSGAWWGGWWERLIQKGLLKRMLGHSKLNYVQLETCLCEVEAVINGRPLTYVTEDQDDLIALTPAMFIQDMQETICPEEEALNAEGLREKYRDLLQLRKELRVRFRKEYLGHLIHRGKTQKDWEFKLGDVVLVGSDNKKRLEWPMARIVELIPGRDGKVRTAKVKTQTSVLVRPLQRLYPLEVSSEWLPSSSKVKSIVKTTKKIPVEEKATEKQETVTRFGRKIKRPDRLGQ